MALEIGANHYQMTYYFMLLVVILGLAYLIDAIRNKSLKHFFSVVGILVGAVILGIAANATALMATKEYADWSTRGKSELTIGPDGAESGNAGGLSREYITQFSYGITESFNLFIPRLFGGSNGEDLGTDSKAYDYLTEQGLPRSRALEFTKSMPLYWGDQPIVAAPAYIGAIIFFLFIIGMFLVRGRTKWWLVGGALMALLLSWGKNFSLLTDFMIDYFPLYDKFRAVSSIQVILELCAPLLAVMTLVYFFKPTIETNRKVRALKFGFFIVAGISAVFLVFKGSFDFTGLSDESYKRYFGDELMTMIRRDREAVYISDTIRSMIFVLLAALTLWMYLKKKLPQTIAIILLGLLIVIDLAGVDLRYVNKGDFVRQRQMDQPFQEMAYDKQIRQDTSIFRVYDPSETASGSGGRTAFFHQSIWGYHAAKPAVIQDLFDFHIYKNNTRVLNMLNVKYVIQQDAEGKSYAALNPDAAGNAWFVQKLVEVNSANAEIKALDNLEVKREAVVNTAEFPALKRFNYPVESTASINLTSYKPNHLTYRSGNPNKGIAVFSEMYYPHGWNAYIDGKAATYFKANYALRAMELPAGDHTVEFKFEPVLVAEGSKITLASSILFVLILAGGIGFSVIRARKEAQP